MQGVDEQARIVSQLKKEAELTRVEVNDLKTVNETLKTKLSEAQESLKSNENLITYLNKQLNDKPGSSAVATILGSTAATSTSFGAKLGKPPAPPSLVSTGFKPSFNSIESMVPTSGQT